MYRLNCQISDDIADRLDRYSKKTGTSKVAVVSMALSDYLTTAEMKQNLLEQMQDPAKLADIMKAFGITEEKLSKQQEIVAKK